MLTELCAESGCIAYVEHAGDRCGVHKTAKRVQTVMAGEKCQRCTRLMKKGEWVTHKATR